MHGFLNCYMSHYYNLIKLIFITNKLTKTNYVNWKRKLGIVLIVEELKWVTQDFAPPIPN